MKLTNAPYLKQQNINDPLDELIILAGSQAWEAYGKEGNGQGWLFLKEILKIRDNTPPVILGDKHLGQLNCLRLAPENRKVIGIYQFGELNEAHKTAICANLSKHTQAETVLFYDNIGQTLENASDYIKRTRAGETMAETVAEEVKKRKPVALDLSDKSLNTLDIVEAFLEWQEQPLRRDTQRRETYRLQDGKAWISLNEEEFRREIANFLKSANDRNYSPHKISKIADLAILEIERLPPENPDLIGFQNCVLNKKTGQLLPHSHTHFLRALEDFPLNTESQDTPHFDDWLDFVANDSPERKNAILAGLYMVLTNRYQWGLFLEATGAAGAGKSIFGEIATILNGRPNTSIIDIKGLEEPKVIAGLMGKTFAYSPDQAKYTGTADGLKRLTGGDTLKAQIYYKGFEDFTPTVVFMMSTNHSIDFRDQNRGIARRRVIIPFERAIPKEKKDVNFIDKVKGEIYGITNKLLSLFPEPETARKLLENYQASREGDKVKREANHLIEFAKAFKIIGSCTQGLQWGSNYANSKTTVNNALFKAYLHYCDCIGLRNTLNLNYFKSAFQDALRDTGEQGEIVQLKTNGIPKINVQWRNREATLNEWQG